MVYPVAVIHTENTPAAMNHLDSCASSDAPLQSQLPIAEIVVALWQRRFWLAKIALGSLVIGYLLTFLIPNMYESSTDLMPPDQQLVASSSLSTMLGASGGAALSSLAAGGPLNMKTPGSVAIGILESRTVMDQMIKNFNLMHVYGVKYEMNARKKLASRTTFNEDKKSGIISITVEDRDRYRARDMASAYVDRLTSLVNNLSTSSARRERIFLEQRLQGVKTDLDSSSHALSQFSSHNATFDPQKQAQSTMDAAAKLQAELISAEAELSSLRTTFTDDNVQVRGLQARIAELRGDLDKINGRSPAKSRDAGSSMPSVRQIPLLGYTYYDLYRKVTMEETLYETLNKQYELARVQEAKEIPPIKVLSVADVAEKQIWPDRNLCAVGLMLLSVLSALLWVSVRTFWASRDESDPFKISARRFAAKLNAAKSAQVR